MSLFYPEAMLYRIDELSSEKLRRMGICGILLDADNTLSAQDAPEPDANALAWIRTMKNEGFHLCIVSNNSAERIAPFAQKLGISFLAKAGKPLPFGFRKAAKQMELTPRQVIAIGDQLFTDVCGARLAGIKSILVQPLKTEDGSFFRLKRRMERPILERFMKKYPERVSLSLLPQETEAEEPNEHNP